MRYKTYKIYKIKEFIKSIIGFVVYIVVIFALALLLFIMIERFEAYKGISDRELGLKSDLIEIESKLEECRKYNVFQKVVSEIARKGYSEDYDCYDHAKELQLKLEELGIDSRICIGEDRKHAWLAVYVEAVEGNFIDPKNELKILEIRNSDLEVVCSCK